MRVLGSMLLVGAAFGAAEPLARADGPLAALVAVAGGVLIACLAAGAASAPAVALGALGALGHALLSPVWPSLGGAALLAFAYAPRAVRARSAPEAVLLVGLAATCGGVGAWLASAFAASDLSLALVAAAMAGLLAGAPWLVPIDDRIATALRASARRAGGASRWMLLRAVVLRRRIEGIAGEVPRREGRRLEQAWQTLLGLVQARESAPRSATQRIDGRIREHVDAFARVWRAVGTRRALADGLDLDALDELRVGGDEMEAEAQAIAEVGWDDGDATVRDDATVDGEEPSGAAPTGDGDEAPEDAPVGQAVPPRAGAAH